MGLRNFFLGIYDEGEIYDEDDDEDLNEQDDDETFVSYIKGLFKKKKNIKEINHNINEKIYLNREQAINIASLDKNLKRSVYRDAIDNGFIYGIIEFKNFYSTLVVYEEELYWYIKVIDGKFGLRDEKENKRGYFNEYSNIRCLVNAKTGKYIYMDEYFDTRGMRMITDEEFLHVLFKMKK